MKVISTEYIPRTRRFPKIKQKKSSMNRLLIIDIGNGKTRKAVVPSHRVSIALQNFAKNGKTDLTEEQKEKLRMIDESNEL